MQIFYEDSDGARIEMREPYATAEYVVAEAGTCPKCASPWRLFSRGCSVHRDREFRGTAVCAVCLEKVGGILIVIPNSLFGIEEDARVLSGPCLVF